MRDYPGVVVKRSWKQATSGQRISPETCVNPTRSPVARVVLLLQVAIFASAVDAARGVEIYPVLGSGVALEGSQDTLIGLMLPVSPQVVPAPHFSLPAGGTSAFEH